MKKYYFYSFSVTIESQEINIISHVSTQHPFRSIAYFNARDNNPNIARKTKYSLISYNEISEEDYDLFISLQKPS